MTGLIIKQEKEYEIVVLGMNHLGKFDLDRVGGKSSISMLLAKVRLRGGPDIS